MATGNTAQTFALTPAEQDHSSANMTAKAHEFNPGARHIPDSKPTNIYQAH
jgi:hypothetical protein